MVTWTALGLWHGATWNFVLWGAFNGVILAVYSVVMRRKKWALPAFRGKLFLGWLINVAMLLFSSVLFRAQSASDAWLMVQKLLEWAPGTAVASEWFFLLCVLLAIHAFCFWNYREDLFQRLGWPGRVAGDVRHGESDRRTGGSRSPLFLLSVLTRIRQSNARGSRESRTTVPL